MKRIVTKHRILLLLWLGCLLTCWGQQEATFSQYMFGHQLLNPAYAGAKQYTHAAALHRAQWLGFEGAPVTQALAVNGRINEKKLGWGLSVMNDQIGPIVNTAVTIDASYHLTLNDQGHQLALGLKLGGHNYNINSDMIQTLTPGDAAFVGTSDFELLPNIGFGVYYYRPRFYIGISIPRMLNNDRYAVSRHGYLIAGALIPVNNQWSVKPSVVFKQSEGSPMGYDLSALVVYDNRFWLGPQLRSAVESPFPNTRLGGAYGMLGGIHINPNWSVGYAYSTGLGDLNSSFNAGTHEILLRFDFNLKTLVELRSPRIF